MEIKPPVIKTGSKNFRGEDFYNERFKDALSRCVRPILLSDEFFRNFKMEDVVGVFYD